ncbi:tail fiber assembly protein [Citrobacter freundii]|uniref:tail fiber assembly protein n=1 Tax=Citrobacter freundii TaxID=546 RepID=UPI002430C23F|nr:tail fiber assembly protein [Citrobacter freundii]WFW90167.1 tail fiber assembly protein [Citrobacter freundii]
MMSYYFSPSKNLFYFGDSKDSYIKTGQWADDCAPVDDELVREFTALAPEGKIRGVVNGKPAWVDIPPLTQDEEVALAESQKSLLIDQANEHINGKQWPGKAAIGRLKGDELAQYNLWLDYLDALEAVDISTSPDIAWPTLPAENA